MSSTNTRKRRRETQQKLQKRIKMTSAANSMKSNSRKPSPNHSNYCNGNSSNNNTNHNRNGYNNNNYDGRQQNNENHNNNTNNSNVVSTLSLSQIEEFCSCNCSIFISYIYHTNGHSLYNILSLENNLEFESIECCNDNCNITNDGSFYICLECIFYCCSSVNGQHLLFHCQSLSHYLYFELSSQSIYCLKCGEYHTSPWTDSMIIACIESATKRLNDDSIHDQYKEIEIEAIEPSIGNIWRQFDCIRDNGLLGIRGTWNLGNTCYMTVLLQMFMHNPLLRNYYLSSYHSLKCKQSLQSLQSLHSCVSCEIESLFCDFYCGINASAVSISNFIGCIWREPSYNLAGQDMHDCHEFFISLTQLMHKFECENNGYNDDALKCKCIVHSTFGGLWSSELKCLNDKCQYVSETTDMFMEINLQPRKLKGQFVANKINNKTIEEALTNYMESEPMPDYKCNKCFMKNCQKDMSIRQLPHTLCLHLKRFEADEINDSQRSPSINNNNNNNSNHNRNKSISRSLSPSVTKNTRSKRRNSNNNNYKYNEFKNNNNDTDTAFDKIDEFVQFPVDELLDLSQFINVNHKNKKINNKKYKLRSMIIHSGVLSSGHYVCYIRKDDNWFYCDDSSVLPSTSDWVKKQNAYMLFYEAQ